MKIVLALLFVCSLSPSFAKKIKVGLCVDNIATDRWAIEIKSIENGIRAKGGVVFVKTALGSTSHQEEQVRELINTQNIDVLILVPVDKIKAASLVIEAQKNGVKVLLYSRNVEGAKADAFVSFNPFNIGVSQANYVIQKFPNRNVILLGGPTKDLNSTKIEQGQLTVLDTSSVNIISNVHVNSWSTKEAYDKVKYLNDSLQQSADVIITGNDMLATGVIKYYNAIKKPIKVIGLDADLGACKRIANNTQEMSVLLDIKKSAYCAAIVAIQLGQHHQPHIKTNGIVHKKVDGVDIYLIDSIVVSKQNLAEITQTLHLYTQKKFSVTKNKHFILT